MKNDCLNEIIDLIFNNLFHRSKSRSVDHGFTTPYDLESLRSKVESRFESVDKLSKGKLILTNFYTVVV